MINSQLIRILLLAAVIAAVFTCCALVNRDRPLPQLPQEYRASVMAALERSGDNRPQLVNALARIRKERLPAMCNIISRMPNYDLANFTADALVDHVNCTFEMQGRVRWKTDVNSPLFLDYVLPHRVACESLENSRRSFADNILPIVNWCHNTRQAAMEVMRYSHDPSVQRMYLGSAFPFDYAPLTAWEFARSEDGSTGCRYTCVLVVSMLRSIGIPARVIEPAARPKFLAGHHATMQYYDNLIHNWRWLDSSSDKQAWAHLKGDDGAILGIMRGWGEVAEYAYPPYMTGDYYGQHRLDRLVWIPPHPNYPSGTLTVSVWEGGVPAPDARIAVYAWSDDYRGWREAISTVTNATGCVAFKLGSNKAGGFPPYMVSAGKGNKCSQTIVSLGQNENAAVNLTLAPSGAEDTIAFSLSP